MCVSDVNDFYVGFLDMLTPFRLVRGLVWPGGALRSVFEGLDALPAHGNWHRPFKCVTVLAVFSLKEGVRA